LHTKSLWVDNDIRTSHQDMEEALTVHFTSVFGQPGEGGFAVDYDSLGFAPADLSALDTPISMEAVWAAIKDMPPDRAPGPDGFTGAFYRSAWEVIKEDKMAGINCVLYGESRAFHLLNNALIVLIPKKPDAATAG